MRLTPVVAALRALSEIVDGFRPADTSGTDKLQTKGLKNLAKYYKANTPKSSCNIKNSYVRREWMTLSDKEKRAYISAVQCLMKKPSRSTEDYYPAPGARSRYEDFVATHINQTLIIHGTGNFLSWHRYFTWTYEQALRHECGYAGYQPYVNWGKYAFDMYNAPFFDGSDTSMSNDGTSVPHNGTSLGNPPVLYVPPGNGGGYVTAGPFKDMEVRLGPVASRLSGIVPPNPSPDGLGYNPRCLRRDISTFSARTASTDQNSTDLIAQNPTIEGFQNVMQGGFNQGLPLLGVHTAGHFWVAGDPGGDLFASPGDPYFFLHHAQIDRTWWIWQLQDPAGRLKGDNALGGTITLNNQPPSRETTIDDVLELGVNAPHGIKIGAALDTLAGTPFCYLYA